MRILLSADRIRSAISGARTEKEIELSLRRHKIRFSYDTSAGFLAYRIPVRSGSVLVYRTCSRSAPFAVCSARPDPRSGSVPGRSGPVLRPSAAPAGYPLPVPRFTWDD